jgi:type VI secretion system protein ImpC
MAQSTTTTTGSDNLLRRIVASMQMEPNNISLAPMIRSSFTEVSEQVNLEDRLLSGLAAIVYNTDTRSGRFEKGKVMEAVSRIDVLINEQLNEVFHHPQFQHLEATWRGIDQLVESANFQSNVAVELMDVSKDELFEDFENNSSDIFGSTLFEKVYIAEYDQYGGRPYGCLIGLYDFTTGSRDIFWLRSMSKVAAASHSPFIGSVSPQFLGCNNMDQVEAIKDLDGLLNQPRYAQWQSLRDSEEGAYIGLTFPRYVVRLPWNPETNPSPGLPFHEHAAGNANSYLWAPATFLFARNVIRSFEKTGWCQYIRGPKGGGLVAGLPVDMYNVRGEDEMRIPVEICIPDYRELEYSRNGIIPLVYRKGAGEATFFSAQSIKRPRKFKDPKDSENAQLVCNLSYTFSVARIAHYVKSIMRDNIGDISTAGNVQAVLSTWLEQYVTTEVKPDDVTMRTYPFRAAQVQVDPQPGRIGYYDCKISILPHIQFEGMDVELRLESRLG